METSQYGKSVQAVENILLANNLLFEETGNHLIIGKEEQEHIQDLINEYKQQKEYIERYEQGELFSSKQLKRFEKIYKEKYKSWNDDMGHLLDILHLVNEKDFNPETVTDAYIQDVIKAIDLCFGKLTYEIEEKEKFGKLFYHANEKCINWEHILRQLYKDIHLEYIRAEDEFDKHFNKQHKSLEDYYEQKEAVDIMQEMSWIQGRLEDVLGKPDVTEE